MYKETTLEMAQAEVKAAKQALRQAEETAALVRKEYASRTKEQKLAVVLHEALCRWNHTDGCSWGYERDNNGEINWAGYAHAEYLAKAVKITTNFPNFNIEEFIQVLALAK